MGYLLHQYLDGISPSPVHGCDISYTSTWMGYLLHQYMDGISPTPVQGIRPIEISPTPV
jgi:hypothetical protein